MSYPGNSSLSPEIQNRILSTFRQTIELAEKGRLQEARLGCDFILKMDSQFAAARKLKERLEGASGPVKAGDLQAAAAAPNAASIAASMAAAQAAAPSAPAPQTSAPPAVSPPASSSRSIPTPPAASIPAAATVESDPFADLPRPSAELGLGLDLDLDLQLDDDLAGLDLGDRGSAPARAERPRESPFADFEDGAGFDPLAGLLEEDAASAAVPPSAGASAGLGASLTPNAPASPSEVATAVPSAAAPAGSGNPRIDELLAEGQAAFEQGEFQSAIDAWSRIFLIDIDHEEAGRRIEEARGLKAERERQGDEQLNEAMRARDEGRLEDARNRLEGLLAEQPENLAARELLEQIQAAEGGEVLAPLPPPAVAAATTGEQGVLHADLPAAQHPVGPAPAPAFPGGAGRARGGGRSLHLVGVAVFLLVAVLAWFLYSNWDNLFPNAAVEQPVAAAPERPSPVRRANQLRLDGDVAGAIELLEGVTPDDPEAAQAGTLLDQLRAEVAASEAEEAAAAEREDSREADRQRLLEEARRAYDERRYLEAARTFRAADDLQTLEGAAADLYRDTREQLLPIAQQIDQFREREWEQVLPTLWRKLEEDPGNRDVKQILTDSYYNMAVRDLRRGDAVSAGESLREVVELDPDDALSARLNQFALSYQQRPVDLLYRIFVGQLEFRK